MGAGIAEVLAGSGRSVVAVEVDDAALARGRGHVERSTSRAVRRGRLTEEAAAELLGRIRLTTSMADLKDCDLVVEAVVERLPVKRQLLTALDGIVAQEAVLATNTSSLSVTEIAAATSRPERVVGMHFFNPAPVQRLVEVVRTLVTEPQVLDDVTALARSLGKSPVVCADRAGFIANALLFGYLNRAAQMFETRFATREDIDAAMRLGCGYPMGPLALLDLVGLDTAYEVLRTMYAQGRDRLHAPAPVLGQLVTAGLLGRKSGRGFYTYEAAGSPVVVDDALTPARQPPRLQRPVERVAVVGGDTATAQLAAEFEAGGFAVTRVGLTGGEVAAAAAADLALVAVPDHHDGTPELFRRLGEVCRPGAVLATTTSTLPVVGLARESGRPADVVGMHFPHPGPAAGVVEVVSAVTTAADVAETARAVSERLGKVAVSCPDRAGFLVEALLFPYLNDAVTMVQARYASADDVDTAMRLGCALPAGPLELLEQIGSDVVLRTQRAIYRESREPGLAPAPLLRQLVAAGRLGRGTGSAVREHLPRP
jgi:3-hydroxybutyryl-CoA dehydrogenase